MRPQQNSNNLSLLDIAFYLFMASVPLEIVGTLGLGLPVSLSLPFGVLFIALCPFQTRTGLCRRFVIPWPLVLLVIPLAISLIHYFTTDNGLGGFSPVFQGVITCSLLSLFLYNYLRIRPRIESGLLILGSTTVITGCLLMAGMGGEISSAERFSVLGFDENNIASILAFGILALFPFFGCRSLSRPLRYALGAMSLLTLAVIVATGSRGGLLSLILSLIAYAVLLSPGRFLQFKGVVGVGLFFVIGGYFLFQNETALARWAVTLEGQKGTALCYRDIIFAKALELITEKPFWGWGYHDGFRYIGTALWGYPIGTHNTYLWLLLTTGVVGFVPFLILFIYPVTQLYRHKDRSVVRQLLTLYLFLMLVFMSLDWINRKQIWIILAMMLAAIDNLSTKEGRASVVHLIRIVPAHAPKDSSR